MKYSKNKNINNSIGIYGAGAAGTQLLASLKLSRLNIIAFFDDNPKLWGTKINEVKIYPPHQIYKFKDNLKQILLAIPSIKISRKRTIIKMLQNLELPILDMPSIDEFTKGTFQPIILENEISVKNTKTLVFCTGKFYYDLIDEREKQGRNDVAIIRFEQLFPLPKKKIENILADYSHVSDVVWAQEEPRNMGAWSHLLLHLPAAQQFRVASRRFYGTPAAGSAARFKRRHQQVLDYVFDRSKNNMR